LQDNGSGLAFGQPPQLRYGIYGWREQLTSIGDGQSTVQGYRTRNTQNNGTSYAEPTINSAVAGYNFWGDLYSFGVAGHNYNDFTRAGGTLGADVNGLYWGSMGYRSSGELNYGVYGSSAYASGAGRAGITTSTERQGIGGAFYGGAIGSWSQGDAMGSVSAGPVFATYNLGNVYTSGVTAELVPTSNEANASRVAAYAVTAPDLKAYDSGSGTFTGSELFVPFSASYAAMLGAAPVVTVSAVGSPAQVYVASISATGFTVAVPARLENVRFNWIAVGARKDAARAGQVPAEIISGNFDTQLRQTMTNDGDTTTTAKPIWHDGQRVRFDAAPVITRGAKAKSPGG